MRNNVFVSCVEELRVRRGTMAHHASLLPFSICYLNYLALSLEALIWGYKL